MTRAIALQGTTDGGLEPLLLRLAEQPLSNALHDSHWKHVPAKRTAGYMR